MSRRSLILILGAGVPLLLASLVLVVFADYLFPPPSFGADSHSRSAIGHRGLVSVLRSWGYATARSRFRSGEKVGPGDLLVLAEPATGTERVDLGDVIERAIRNGARVLLVLPKWSGRESRTVQGWLAEVRLVEVSAATAVLNEFEGGTGFGVDRGRAVAGSAWQSSMHVAMAPDIDHPQVVSSPPAADIDRLLWHDDGFLLARNRAGTMYALSDPDLINNAGIGRGANSALLAGLLRREIRPSGIVIDETTHGYSLPDSFWATVVRYPLVLFSAPLVLLLVLVVWRCMHRFGRPEQPPPRLAPGKAGLLENMASLLFMGGHSRAAARQYVHLSFYLAARHLGLQPDLQRLASLSAARCTGTNPDELDRRLRDRRIARHQWQAALAVAREAFSWRKELCRDGGDPAPKGA